MQAQRAQRAPTRLPQRTRNHVILINFDSVTKTLIEKLVQYHYPYVLIVPDLNEALRLHDLGYRIMLGELDKPETYEFARASQALAVVLTQNDQVNTNIAATVQDISETVPIISTANFAASVDILQLAGADHILQLAEMMGQTLSRRVSDGETLAHVVGEFDNLVIAEAMTRDTYLVGKTIRESCLRETTGLSVVGVWTRGHFELASPETLIDERTVLVMAGAAENVARYNLLLQDSSPLSEPVLIIGGGRVGKATGRALAARGLDYRIIEKQPSRILNEAHYVVGDAAELEILEQGGIRTTPTVIVTTHDDDMNIYLTIYCRRLRPDVQIISRAGLERNIATLHRAGADFVLSYASTGANAIINLLGRDNILMVAEGLDLFEVEIPPALEGKSLAQSGIRTQTGCTVVASRRNGKMQVLTDPHEPLPNNCRIVLVGTPDAEKKFLAMYKNA